MLRQRELDPDRRHSPLTLDPADRAARHRARTHPADRVRQSLRRQPLIDTESPDEFCRLTVPIAAHSSIDTTCGKTCQPMAPHCHQLQPPRRTVSYMADIGKAPEGFPRRMQAARALAGVTIEDLAERLADEPGLGDRSLRNIENGSAGVQRSRQRVILEACGVPSVFIDADLWVLEAVYDGLAAIPQEQREAEGDEVLVTRALRLLAEQPARDERIARLERLVAAITPPEDAGRPEGPMPGLEDDAEAPAPQRQAPGRTRTPRPKR